MKKHSLYIEKELLEATAAGDETAFAKLFEHYQPIIYTMVIRLSGSESMAEEIVQDSFLKVWLNRHQLTGMVNFGGWLYRIASNLTYDALRKAALQKKRKRTVAGQMAEHQSDSPFTSTETLLLESQYARLVQEALGTLGERQLQAFRLVKLEGLSREEAASRMKISLSSLKTHLAVSLQKIRAYCISRLDALGVLIFLWANR